MSSYGKEQVISLSKNADPIRSGPHFYNVMETITSLRILGDTKWLYSDIGFYPNPIQPITQPLVH